MADSQRTTDGIRQQSAGNQSISQQSVRRQDGGQRDLLLRDVEVAGALTDVLVRSGRIDAIGTGIDRPPGVEVLDGDGGALLPGLHDHHIHLAALAAAMCSVSVGPPEVTSPEAFARTLRRAAAQGGEGWVRAVGYHESVAGPLDRRALDRLVADRPLRVQDRSGIRWTLNSRGLELVDAEHADHQGVLRDGAGVATGVLHRADEWLSARIDDPFPDLSDVGRHLASYGVTGVTDCTPYRTVKDLSLLADALRLGSVDVDVVVTGGVELVDAAAPPGLRFGPVKLILDEVDLPDLTDTADAIAAAHRRDRPVAIHVVTAATLAFALAAWDIAGIRSGDRIEHGALISADAARGIARRGLTVVTQPGFVVERGDRYLLDVEPADVPDLYRCATLRELGVAVAGSTDAPYTDPDPWLAVRAAVDRTTASGAVVDPAERLSAAAALDLFLGDPMDPGGPPRRIVVGAPGDLCLLHRPLTGTDEPVTAEHVRATFRL